MTDVVCAMLGNHSNGKSEMSERGKSVFEREPLLLLWITALGICQQGKYEHLRNLLSSVFSVMVFHKENPIINFLTFLWISEELETVLLLF